MNTSTKLKRAVILILSTCVSLAAFAVFGQSFISDARILGALVRSLTLQLKDRVI